VTLAVARLGDVFHDATGWRPHALQKSVLADTTRNQVLAAGRRAGKSETGGRKLLPYVFKALGERAILEARQVRREYWIVGPEYSDSEKEFRKLYNALRFLQVPFDRPGTYYNAVGGELHISLWSGLFQVHGKSAKYPETLVGEGLSGVVMSEAAKIKPTVYTKFVRPTLIDFKGWSFLSSTPEGRNWFYRLWQAGQDPDRPDWRSWRLPSWANPFLYQDMKVHEREADVAIRTLQTMIRKRVIPKQLPIEAVTMMSRLWPGVDIPASWESAVEKTWARIGLALGIDPEIVALMLDLSEELFNQEIAAQFNEFVGRVFKDFDEEIHVGDFGYEPGWSTYAALDYGFTNPFVWLLIQVDPFGQNIRIIDEYFEMGRTTEEAAAEIQARGLVPGSLKRFFPDPAEPDRSRTLAKLFQITPMAGTGGERGDRIEWIRRKLRAGVPSLEQPWMMPGLDGVPQLQINRRCKETIREFNVYRYPKTAEEAALKDRSAPEEPLKKDDHTIEALGRFMMGYFGSPWRTKAPARQSRARVGRTARR
jgi:Terminase large subunit, T4likevirus-type, N-terminal